MMGDLTQDHEGTQLFPWELVQISINGSSEGITTISHGNSIKDKSIVLLTIVEDSDAFNASLKGSSNDEKSAHIWSNAYQASLRRLSMKIPLNLYSTKSHICEVKLS